MPRNSKIKGLTVEIGGDTTKLGKSMDDSKSRSKKLQTELREVNRLLKGNPNDVELLAQKEELLKQRVSETEKQLEALKGAQEDVNQLFEKGEIGEADYRSFEREIKSTEQTLNRLNDELSKTSDQFGEIQQSSENVNFKNTEGKIDNLKNKFKTFAEESSKNISKVSEQLTKTGSTIENAGTKLNTVSVAAAGALAAGVKYATDFEDAIAKVNTIADTSKVPLDDLKNQIIDLSNETGVGASEIAESVYNAISAGQDTADAVNFVKNATALAKAGFAETGDSLDILTTILNAYGLKAEEVGNVSDILIQTQNLGKTTVAQLASTMGKIIPTANSYGVNLQQIATGYAVMTSNGVATAESTTYMNSMLNELGKSGTKASNVLKEKTGKSFSELMGEGKSLSEVLKIVSDAAEKDGKKFNDMWGSAEAAKAGTILLGDSVDKFNGVLEKMGKSSGATDTAFGKLNTTSAKTKKTVNELKNTAIELGSEVLKQAEPLLKDVMNGVKGVTEWMKKLNPEQKQMLVKGIELIAIIGPGTTAVGKLTKNVGSFVSIIPKVIGKIVSMTAATEGATVAQEGLNVAQSLSPAGALITIITGLVAAISILAMTMNDEASKVDEVTAKYQDLYNEIIDNKRAYDEMKDARDKALKDVSAEYDYYDTLRDKLDRIVDSSGKVKKGHEDEADIIINTLSAALDIEIKKEDGVIKNYKDLQTELKKTIALKKAEAMQSAYSDSYNKAIKEQTQAFIDYNKAIEAESEAQKKLTDAQKKLKSTPSGNWEETTTGRVWKSDYNSKTANEEARREVEKYTKALDKAKSTAEKQQSIYLGYINTISNYENMTAAIASNNQKEIADATARLESNFITAKNGTREMLEQQVTDLQQKYDSMKGAVESGAPGITQSMVDSTKNMLDLAKKELKKLPEEYTDTLNKSKDAVDQNAPSVAVSWRENLAEQLSEMTGKKVEFENAGRGQIQMYVGGIAKGKPMANSKMKELVNSVINKVKDKKADAQTAAGYLLDGINKGISDSKKQNDILGSIGSFCRNLIKGFKAFFQIKSPSKATREIGGYLMEGLSVGLDDGSSNVVKSAKTSSKRILEVFDNSIASRKGRVVQNASELAAAAANALNSVESSAFDYPMNDIQAKIITEHRITDNNEMLQIEAILSKMDILTKTVEISSAKEIRLNDDTLVGATAGKYDKTLGTLAARRSRGW